MKRTASQKHQIVKAALIGHADVKLAALAQELGVGVKVAYQVLSSLEDRGLVQRSDSKYDSDQRWHWVGRNGD